MKITHTIEWEPQKGSYRILRLTGSKRQPTLDEAKEYIAKNNLPTEIWCCAFFNNGEVDDGYLNGYEINKTLTLYEYTGHFGDKESGLCPICGKALELFHDDDKCPVCGKKWEE